MPATPFPYKTAPWAKQREALQRSAARPAFALVMEPGTGKTKVTLDTAAWLYLRGKIDTLLVLAPNGVHRSWLLDEVPTHLSEAIEDVELLLWESGRSTRWTRMRMRAAPETDGLLIAAFNTESVTSVPAHRVIMRLLDKRQSVMLVVDESTDIARAKAKRTQRILAYGRRATYRRILTGDYGDDAVLSLYSQFKFLDWRIIGAPTSAAFRDRYAEWEEGERYKGADADGRPMIQTYTQIKRDAEGNKVYKNLDELHRRIAPYLFRVRLDEMVDMPPKIYAKWYFELTPAQRRVYDTLASEYQVDLSETETMTAEQAAVRTLRLQQVANGYETSDDGEPTRDIPNSALPRLDALVACLAQYPGKTIIWARFTRDVDHIMTRLGDSAVRYDGVISAAAREVNKARFLSDPDARYFVAKQQSAARGHNLQAAVNVVFYSNLYSYLLRNQAERRAWRAGQRETVRIIDLVAARTVDEYKIIPQLRAKKNVHDVMTHDMPQEWL